MDQIHVLILDGINQLKMTLYLSYMKYIDYQLGIVVWKSLCSMVQSKTDEQLPALVILKGVCQLNQSFISLHQTNEESNQNSSPQILTYLGKRMKSSYFL